MISSQGSYSLLGRYKRSSHQLGVHRHTASGIFFYIERYTIRLSHQINRATLGPGWKASGERIGLKRTNLKTLPPAKLRFIEPMYAQLIKELPEGPAWEYEIKFDGYRCLAGRNERRAILWSRRGNDFSHQFPGIALACERLKPDTLIDGEVIAIDQN